MKLTVSKRYNDIPFAHRQSLHDGHCRFVHGHNWSVEFCFRLAEGHHLDQNGFIVDFGKLDCLKNWIASNLDHRLLIGEDDPELEFFRQHNGKLWLLTEVHGGSCEGLAWWLFRQCNEVLRINNLDRVACSGVTLWEDSRNHSHYAE